MRSGPITLAALLGLSLLAGCQHNPGGIAPSTIPLDPGGYTVVKTGVLGSDCQVSLLGIVPITDGNQTHQAIADALAQAPGATALVDVTSDAYSAWFVLWSQTCTEVRGTAVTPH
jgi:hypothetical protein